MEKIIAIGKKEAQQILDEAESNVLRARYLFKDYYTGVFCASPEFFEVLCELVATYKLLKATFSTVLVPSNEVKENYYKVDPFVFESIKSSLALLIWHKEQLLLMGLSMEEQ